MKRLLTLLVLVASIIVGSIQPILADSLINNLGAGTALTGPEQIPMFQTANPAVTTTPNALKTFIGTTVNTACGNSGGPINPGSSGTIQAAITSRTVTGATDTIASTDCGNIVYYNSASSIAISQPAPTGNFAAGFFTTICQINNGIPTVTPGSGTIGGGATYALPAGGTAPAPICATYQSDGTNFNLVPSFIVNAALLTSGTIPSSRLGFGTGVFTAAANTLSSAGGLTSTIASGTAALGTAAIASGACATAVTVAATNVATTDIVTAGFAADPTATTGYLPTAMLTIVPYPTPGDVNFKVCNLTGSPITPSAVTINWRVTR